MKAAVLACVGAIGVACASLSWAPRTVAVLVLNNHSGHGADNRDNLERTADLVRTTGADIVLLQEVDRRTRRSGWVDQPALLGQLTGLQIAFGRTLDYDAGEYGIATLARRLFDDRLVPLPVEPAQPRAGGSHEPRGVLVVSAETSARAWRILNTHLDAGSDDRYRLQEVAQLLAQAALEPDTPTVLGGDFNATPESAVIARVVAAGFVDAWAACGQSNGYTYPARSPVKRIDYLFLSSKLRCTSADVLPYDGSDHLPVLVGVTDSSSAIR